MEYVVDSSHPFFREILVHYLAFLGFAAIVNLGRSRVKVRQLEDMLNREQRLPTQFTFPLDFPPHVRGAGRVADSVLLNAQDLAVAIQDGTPIPPIRYEDAEPTAPISKARSKQSYSLHRKNPPGYLYQAAQVSLGSAYESVKDKIERAYGRDPVRWPKVMEYFRHIRNGCFHNNMFNIRPPQRRTTAIDANNPPSWRTSVMPSDATMNTRGVLGDFLDVGDCPILLGDVAKQLQSDGVVV